MGQLSRRQFLSLCGALGISAPLQPVISACNDQAVCGDSGTADSIGSVIIIGAGVAGMSAGYLLTQAGIECQILEAASSYGGRMKRTTGFTDFPLPLGAEWLHAGRTTLQRIVNDPAVNVTIKTQGYSAQDEYGYYDGDELSLVGFNDTQDLKFINSTWFDFYEHYIVPSIRSKIQLNTQVTEVDYREEKIRVSAHNEQHYEADKVIVTVPLPILQDGDIEFIPALPADKRAALKQAKAWGGLKVFLKFSEQFYPAMLEFDDSETDDGQRYYYDAAYGQQTKANILGLFAVGEQARQYQELSDTALRDYILSELDEVFDGVASEAYIRHIVQNWSEEPYIRSAYLEDGAPTGISTTLFLPVNDRLFFAGEAYTKEDDWGAAHNAAQSARDALHYLGVGR